ncbi:30S ribosomal protein S15 [Artemisia annua]|uniref:30S ribosomal protein S15 n=1 Tax=Artemisia annua TaxID=35608 RepID=A0A2U1QJ82_ARTAN|nr:30S ribosomal protein S15 [Artemisia annua]
MVRVRLPFTKKGSKLPSADSDIASGSRKKRKIAEHEQGVVVPWTLYRLIQEALDLRKHLETNKNDEDSLLDLESAEDGIRILAEEYKKVELVPRDWKYDPATAKDIISYKPVIAEREDDYPLESHNHCCAPLKEPLEMYADTEDVPLNEEEKKIWKKILKFDEKIPGLTAISLSDSEKERMPIKVDNPIVSLIGNFAIAAFNEVIEKHVKKGEHKNLHDFEFMDCAYIKMRGSEYYFYMTIEAVEEGKLGVYETKVRLEWDDGSKSLSNFVLTDRTPRGKKKRVNAGKRKRVKPIQMTDPDDWCDPMEDKFSGMKPRSKTASCMGYDYHTPWGFEGP